MTRLEGRAWRKLRAAILARSDVCHICDEPIDMALSGLHADGPTVDHITPVIDGGPTEPWNLAPAHRRCNLAKGRQAVRIKTDLSW